MIANIMKMREIDWRLSSLTQVLSALSEALKANEGGFKNLGQAYEEYQLDAACDHQNDLCGIAFVAAQTYIAAAISDINAIRGEGLHLEKKELLRTGTRVVADTTLTQIQLCDTVANYYKHRDEWPYDWSDCKKEARHTTTLLQAAGFTRQSEYICTTAATLLLGDMRVESLNLLADILASWRLTCITAAKS